MWYICITFRALCGRNPFQPDWRTVLWKESRPSRPGICAPARSMAAVGSARLPASLLARPAVALPTSSARTRRRLTGKWGLPLPHWGWGTLPTASGVWGRLFPPPSHGTHAPRGKMDGACCKAERSRPFPTGSCAGCEGSMQDAVGASLDLAVLQQALEECIWLGKRISPPGFRRWPC